jgi:hypothetical protein
VISLADMILWPCLALDPGFALVNIDQVQPFTVRRSFESHRAPHARGQRVAVSQRMDGVERSIVGGCHRPETGSDPQRGGESGIT